MTSDDNIKTRTTIQFCVRFGKNVDTDKHTLYEVSMKPSVSSTYFLKGTSVFLKVKSTLKTLPDRGRKPSICMTFLKVYFKGKLRADFLALLQGLQSVILASWIISRI